MAFFVSKENRIGQVTWTVYESEAAFERFYADKMNDGTPVREAYPKIHYKGTDEDECRRINHEIAEQRRANPNSLVAWTLAEMGDIKGARKLYEAGDTA